MIIPIAQSKGRKDRNVMLAGAPDLLRHRHSTRAEEVQGSVISDVAPGSLMARPGLEVADILRNHGPAWRYANRGHVSLGQLKVMSAIERCRTAALGPCCSALFRRLFLEMLAAAYEAGRLQFFGDHAELAHRPALERRCTTAPSQVPLTIASTIARIVAFASGRERPMSRRSSFHAQTSQTRTAF